MVALSHAHDGHQTGVNQRVDARVGQLQSAAHRIAVHRVQFFLGDALHSHTARMKSELLGLYGFASAKHSRNFGLHRDIGAGDYLPNTINPLRHSNVFLLICRATNGPQTASPLTPAGASPWFPARTTAQLNLLCR